MSSLSKRLLSSRAWSKLWNAERKIENNIRWLSSARVLVTKSGRTKRLICLCPVDFCFSLIPGFWNSLDRAMVSIFRSEAGALGDHQKYLWKGRTRSQVFSDNGGCAGFVEKKSYFTEASRHRTGGIISFSSAVTTTRPWTMKYISSRFLLPGKYNLRE